MSSDDFDKTSNLICIYLTKHIFDFKSKLYWNFQRLLFAFKMSEKKSKEEVDMLHEDDEFEEFETDDWDIRKEDQTDIKV